MLGKSTQRGEQYVRLIVLHTLAHIPANFKGCWYRLVSVEQLYTGVYIIAVSYVRVNAICTCLYFNPASLLHAVQSDFTGHVIRIVNLTDSYFLSFNIY